MKRLLLLAVFSLLPGVVHAQAANYCDTLVTPAPGTAVAGSTLPMQVCLGPNDVNGVPLASVTGWTVYDNGVSTALTLTKGATSTVTGLTLWSGPWIAPGTPSTHTLQVTATGTNSSGQAKESPKSNPFVLTLSAAPAAPAAPVKLSVGP